MNLSQIWQRTRRANSWVVCGAVALFAVAAATAQATGSVYGSISGRVTYASNHKPVANVVVGAYQGNSLHATAVTAANGTYKIFDLPAGPYKIYFFPASGNGRSTWYLDKATPGAATAVEVSAGKQTTAVSQTLAQGATVIGKVIRRPGTSASPVAVKLFTVTSGSPRAYAATLTEAGSLYRFSGIPAGEYIVEFKIGHRAAWYAGAGKRSVDPRKSAQVITLATTSAVSGIDGSPYGS